MAKQIPNRYPGKCATCGQTVAVEAGLATKTDSGWKVTHRDGACPTVSAPPSQEAPTKMTFTPTGEQSACQTLFDTGSSMVIEAGAGTGKTATLKLLAQSTTRQGQYLAFNRAIVEEAKAKFPSNVACNTAHSLAFRAVGKRYSHRLNGPRMRSDQIAMMLGTTPIKVTYGKESKTLAAGFLAGHVMKAITRFCQSADLEPERKHVAYIDGIDLPTTDGKRTFFNNDQIAGALVPQMRKAWADLVNPDGQLPFKHDHYLKLWQLSGPRINADFILFDEAQDANPVMAAIVAAQDHAQVVYVGDSQQAIYEFTGAVNTLGTLGTEHRTFLSQSFRFGPAIADTANAVLERLDAELRLAGTPTIPSQIGILEREDAILCRTNANAVSTVLQLMEMGRRPHLVGGGAEVVSFAKAARELMNSGYTSHPELACFTSWESVREYVEHDAQGNELRLMVKLVDEFGVPTILQALDGMANEKTADVIVSTAHKAKGREWDRVRLSTDFPLDDEDGSLSDGEMRLLYVAVTRAKLHLDLTAVMAFFAPPEAAEGSVEELDNERLRWVDGVG